MHYLQNASKTIASCEAFKCGAFAFVVRAQCCLFEFSFDETSTAVGHVKAPCIVCGRVCGPRPQMRTLIRQQAERLSFPSPTSVIRKPTPDTLVHSDYPSTVFAMSSHRQNLSLSVEHPSPSCNRTARVVQMPEFVNTEENHVSGRTVSAISSYLVYTKLTIFRSQRAGAV